MKAYKLFRKMKDGQLAPLFINKKQRIPIGEWLQAEAHRTKGYAYRPGWHASFIPEAPHLSTKGRVWCEVEVEGWRIYDRPTNQGGAWILAERMRVIRELSQQRVNFLLADHYCAMENEAEDPEEKHWRDMATHNERFSYD